MAKKNSIKSKPKTNFKSQKNFGKYKFIRTNNSRPEGSNTNDTGSWYMLTPELGKLATAVNMLTPNGLDMGFADGVNLKSATLTFPREPGVAANYVNLIPGGVSDGPLSALNEACRAMFTYIRSKLMKNITRYEKTDLFKAVYAMANVFAWVEFLKVILRSIKKVEIMNRYTPSVLLSAFGIDSTNLAEFSIILQRYLEQLLHRLDSMVVPKIPLFEEVIHAFSTVYIDEDIAKAQLIINIPVYIWKFTIDSVTGKGKLVPKFYQRSTKYTVNDLINFTEDLISELLNDEDLAFMSGDILAAYSGNLYILSKEISDSPIEFVYSKEYLEKWHNSAQHGVSPASSIVSNWDVTEATSGNLDPYLVFDPTFTYGSVAQFTLARRACGNRYLDFYDRDITPEQIMNATRWMYNYKILDEPTYKFKFKSLGSQLIQYTVIHYLDKDGQEASVVYNGYESFTHTPAGWNVSENSLVSENLIRKWNYSPLTILMCTSTTVTGESDGYISVEGDLGNYTVIASEILKQMNELANYTLLGVQPLIQGK